MLTKRHRNFSLKIFLGENKDKNLTGNFFALQLIYIFRVGPFLLNKIDISVKIQCKLMEKWSRMTILFGDLVKWNYDVRINNIVIVSYKDKRQVMPVVVPSYTIT